MPGLVKDRYRNQTVSFRVSPEERRQIEARIIACGLPKGQYFIQSLLNQEINITLGRWQSDRLSIELRRLRELIMVLSNKDDSATLRVLLDDLKELLQQVIVITAAQKDKNAE